jgi:signal transduction histidine kinase
MKYLRMQINIFPGSPQLSDADVNFLKNEKFKILGKIRSRAFLVAICLWSLYFFWDNIFHSHYSNLEFIRAIRLIGLFLLSLFFLRLKFCSNEDSAQLQLISAVIVAMLSINAMSFISPVPDRYIDYWGGEILIYLYLYMLLGISPIKALAVGLLLFIFKFLILFYQFEAEVQLKCLNDLECQLISERQFNYYNAISFIYILSVIVIGSTMSFWLENLLMNNILKQRDLEALKQEAEQAREFILQYTKSVAHDLLSPMSTLNDLLHGMNPAQDGSTKLMASIISKSSSKINSIYNEINSYSSEYKARPVKVNLSELIDQTILSVRPLANKLTRPINYRNNTHAIYAFTDPNLISQVFENILINAIKHAKVSTPNKSHIIVRLSKNGSTVSLKIMDRGNSESRNQLVFLNSKNEKSNKFLDEIDYQEKSGFGLKIISNNIRLLEKINHSFYAHIRNPIGTIFTINLPLVDFLEK